MMQMKKRLNWLAGAALVVVVAACAGPIQAGIEGADTLATNTRLSWSYGSAVLSGSITGITGGSTIQVQGIADGFYPGVCRNGGGNDPDPWVLAAPSGNERDVPLDKRGSVRFGSKKNEVGYEIANPVLATLDFVRAESEDPRCWPGGSDGANGWEAYADVRIWFIEDIALRFGDVTLADAATEGWTYRSWSCTTLPVTSTSNPYDATLSCTEGDPATAAERFAAALAEVVTP